MADISLYQCMSGLLYMGVSIIYSAVYHRVFWFRADLNLTPKTIQKISRN